MMSHHIAQSLRRWRHCQASGGKFQDLNLHTDPYRSVRYPVSYAFSCFLDMRLSSVAIMLDSTGVGGAHALSPSRVENEPRSRVRGYSMWFLLNDYTLKLT